MKGLEICGLSKSYGSVRAVDKVDLKVKMGQVLALLGENGAGKSTLVAILSGAVQPDSGVIQLNDERVEFLDPSSAIKAGIGVVNQDAKLVDNHDGRRKYIARRSPSFLDSQGRVLLGRARKIAAELDMTIDLQRYVAEMSLGQKQQIEILKLVLLDCAVMIFDEAATLLSPSEQQRFFALLAKLKKADKAESFLSVTGLRRCWPSVITSPSSGTAGSQENCGRGGYLWCQDAQGAVV